MPPGTLFRSQKYAQVSKVHLDGLKSTLLGSISTFLGSKSTIFDAFSTLINMAVNGRPTLALPQPPRVMETKAVGAFL